MLRHLKTIGPEQDLKCYSLIHGEPMKRRKVKRGKGRNNKTYLEITGNIKVVSF